MSRSVKAICVVLVVSFLVLGLQSCKKTCVRCLAISKKFYEQCDPPDASLIVPDVGDTILSCTEIFDKR